MPGCRSVVAAGFAERAAALGRLNVLPPVSKDAYARINAVRRCAPPHVHGTFQPISDGSHKLCKGGSKTWAVPGQDADVDWLGNMGQP